jgi:O-antigen ligase
LTPVPYGAVEPWSIASWEVGVFAIMVLWGILVLKEGRLNLCLNPLIWPMVALLIVALIQVLPLGFGERQSISFDPYATKLVAIKLIASICFFLLFTTFVNTDKRRDLAVKVILILCLLIALVGIGQNYLGKAIWQRGTFGPFVNRNHFAGFLEMGVGLAGGLIIGRSVRRELLAIYASGLLVICAGIVLSASRGGLLALGAEVIFLAMVFIPSFFARRKERTPWMIVVTRSVGVVFLGAAVIFGSIFLVGSEGLVKNIAQTRGEVTSEAPATERYSRLDIWSATRRLIEDHPYFGVGLGAYQYAYTRYDLSSGAQRVEQSHNDYLQIVADAGLAGGLIALVFIVILFTRGLSASQTRDRRKRAIILGALTGCFGIAVHSFVDFNLQITANAQLFLALAAVATAERSRGAVAQDHEDG